MAPAKRAAGLTGWRYLVVWATFAIIPTSAAWTLNAAVDPLWYDGGNHLFDENFPFNERFSKANLFVRTAEQYDCVVLGSSRTTLLDARRVRGFDCFNFSVSNGNVEEYRDLLEFVLSRTDLSMVVLGVDGFNFADTGLGSSLPEFVLRSTEPPPRIESYLSLDVLDFSLRSLVSRSHRTRFYDQEFACDTMPNATPFVPRDSIDPRDPYGGLVASPTNTIGPFRPERAEALEALRRSVDLDAVWVGYVPPLLSLHVAHMDAAGYLDDYLTAVWIASRAFDRFLDFSVPSDITADPSNTYDGSHFYRRVNDRVAEALSGGDLSGSLPVHELDLESYRRAFRERLAQHVHRAASGPSP